MPTHLHEAGVPLSLLRPDPAKRAGLEEIRDDLMTRIDETEREGWFGGVERMKSASPQSKKSSPRSTGVLALPSSTAAGVCALINFQIDHR
jgi:hypothetical protein